MKTSTLGRSSWSLLVLLGLLTSLSAGLAQKAPYVYIFSPTNNSTYLAPANLTVYVRALGNTNPVQTVQVFAGSMSLGILTNGPGVLVTNVEPLFPFPWSNVLAGNYALKAIATDINGLSATSSVVNVSVVTNFPPARPTVYIYSPTNNALYLAPANLTLLAHAYEPTGVVQTVEFFAGNTSLGLVPTTNSVPGAAPLFSLGWSNVLAGNYALKAVATDLHGLTATSAVVNISVVTNLPPVRPTVYIYSPTNGANYLAPASLTIFAHAYEPTGNVQSVQFFAGTTSLGTVLTTNTVLGAMSTFALPWSNVPLGTYALRAVATDFKGLTSTSSVVSISVITNPPPVPPTVYIYSPTNGANYLAPASLSIFARAYEPTGNVQSVQFFAGTTSLGTVLTTNTVLGAMSTFALPWSNVPLGTYALKAVATDFKGLTSTSSVVSISVITNSPPPNVPFALGFWYPTNGQTFTALANIGVHARVTDSNVVRTVEYFANAVSLGVVSNTAGTLFTNSTAGNPFFLLWSNVPAGSYALSAVATDSAGLTATSSPINISVLPHTNRPPEVRITSPPNAAAFKTPLNLPLYAFARDADGFVTSVEFFANGTNSLGLGGPVLVTTRTNPPPSSYYTNYFFLVWSNAPAGQYALTATATDNSNAVTVSLPVTITILPPTPPPTNYSPIVTVTAIDPIAIEGTNCWVYPGTTNSTGTWTNWVAGTGVPITNCGPKNATFSLYRSGDTNNPLTVNYALGGTASNGVDYVSLPGVATILAGQRRAFLSVVPIDGPPDTNTTVILKLLPSTNTPPAYAVGSPPSAAALIIDLPPVVPTSAVLPDKTFHVSASGPNGAWFHVEYSTDILHWTPICTNQVVNGSIDFIDPDASTSSARFYRALPEAKPPQ